MKFITLKKASKNDIYESKSNAMMLIIAFICAVTAWFIISMTYYPSENKELLNIPVVISTDGTTAGKNGLEVINNTEQFVNISFECSRTDYKRINKSTVQAYVDFDNITIAGEHTLSVQVKTTRNGLTMIDPVVSPETITLKLDKYSKITKNVSTDREALMLNLPENKTIIDEELYCDPTEISIKGPESDLKMIDRCVAVSDKAISLDSTKNITSKKILLLTEDGKEIPQNNITITPSAVNISAEVLTLKSVPIHPSFNSTSETFDTNSLKYHFEPSEITIGVPDNIEAPSAIEIPIHLNDLDIGYSKQYPLTDKRLSGTKDINNVESVTFTLEDDGLDSKDITLTKNELLTTHVPKDDCEYSIENKQITVRIIGPKDIISSITASDLQAEVNLTGADKQVTNPFPYDVDVSCKTHNNVWAVTTQLKVNISRTPKSETTTPAASRNT